MIGCRIPMNEGIKKESRRNQEGIKGNHPLIKNNRLWPIVNKYREGKVKRSGKATSEIEPKITYKKAVECPRFLF